MLLNFRYFREIRVVKLLIIITVISTFILFTIYYYKNPEDTIPSAPLNPGTNLPPYPIVKPRIHLVNTGNESNVSLGNPERWDDVKVRNRIIRDKIERLTAHNRESGANLLSNMFGLDSPSMVAKYSTGNIHIFYVAPVQWSIPRNLTNQSERIGTELTVQGVGEPNIIFYPFHGLYTTNEDILRIHFQEIKNLGIETIILTWNPLTVSTEFLTEIFTISQLYRIQISIEIDDYPGRSVETVRGNFDYFSKNFFTNPAMYKVWSVQKKRFLKLFYIKDVNLIPETDWMMLLTDKGELTIRSAIETLVLGHVSARKHSSIIRRGGFNGFYTRLTSNGATYTSTWKNWSSLKKFADKYRLLFIPTVGPGYNERKKQPKVGGMRRHRTNGQYYGVGWRTAMSVRAQYISIGSYNDWPAGNQIEAAITKIGYKDYQPGNPTKYLDLTRHWVQECIRTKENLLGKGCTDWFNNTVC